MSHRVWGPAVLILSLLPLFLASPTTPSVSAATPKQTSGSLQIVGSPATSFCPLKHTEVRGAISGFVSRVTVTQIFENPATAPIEAVYSFPLPENAAVDEMNIQVGGRTVRGVIKKREEARAIYEHAKNTGHVAALLDQERPNIFTQAIANVMPGEQVSVTISYVETLRYENGSYEFVFPMVVGPRYIPGQATSQHGPGWSPDTDRVPDASHITPHVAPEGVRAGHDISLELAIDAGVPIQELTSLSHEIDVEHTATHTAKVSLRNQGEIPNRDFILKYKVAGSQISDAVLTSAASAKSKFAAGGYFSLILQPPVRVPESDITPKELVFVLDTSGSMMGFPIEKGKALVEKALDELYPGDTFNLITFSGDTQILFPEPAFPTADNIRIAKQFLAGRSGNGGTEMMKAIRAALAPSDAQDHVRIVCFITDGFVGNDMEIIGEVHKHPRARVFSFGIGNSVNRFLLDGMAKAGRGAVEYVTLNDDADKASHRLYERIRSPLLTDVSIDWGHMPVADVYPARIPDLFSGQPLVITGRYTGSAHGTIRLRGTRAGESFVRDIAVDFSSHAPADELIANFWARRKIDDLMSQDWSGAQQGKMKPALQDQITALGLDYRLMTQFTSFVAVEDRVVTTNGKPERIEVPVEMPEGVSREGVFGEPSQSMQFAMAGSFKAAQAVGVVGGAAGGLGGGVFYLNKSGPAAPPTPIAGGTRDSEEMGNSIHMDEKPSKQRALMESKLAPALLATFDCWHKSKSGCKSVQDGKVEISIWLTDDPNAALEQLKQLGLEISADRSSSKSVVGRLPVEKLEALARLSQIKFVSPMRR